MPDARPDPLPRDPAPRRSGVAAGTRRPHPRGGGADRPLVRSVAVDDGSTDELVGRDRGSAPRRSALRGRPLPPELRQERRPRRRVRARAGPLRRHARRRLAGRPGRDPADDLHAGGRRRPRLRLEADAPRPAFEDDPEPVLQRRHAPRLRHPAPRFQLRAEGVPRRGRQARPRLRRTAPLHPAPREVGGLRPHRRAGRAAPRRASTAARSSDSSGSSAASSTSSPSCS